MHQVTTSSQIAAASAAWTVAGAQTFFGVSGANEPSCEGISFSFDHTPSHCFEIDRGDIGVERFADSASRVYSYSLLSNDDATSASGAGGADAPPPAGGGSDSGDGSGKPVPKITTYDVFHALLSIPLRHEVRFGEALVVFLLHEKAWVEEVSKAKREAMKKTAHGLEDLERELKIVKEKLIEKESAQRRIKIRIESLLHDVTSVFLRRRSPGTREKTPLGKLRGEIDNLRKDKEELEDGISRAKIAREWIDRIGWSEYGYVFLTDAGLEALNKLKPFKDDERMGYMAVDEYLSNVVEGSRD